MKKFMLWNQRHPYWVVLFIILGSLAASFFITDIRIDTSAKSMMMEDDPDLGYYNETLKKFGSDNIVVIFIKDNKLFTPEKLKSLDDMVNTCESVEGVYKVESLYSVSNFKNEMGILNNNPLMDWVPETFDEADRVKDDALKNTILRNNLISEDGTATAVNLYLDSEEKAPGFDLVFTEKIESIIKKYSDTFETVMQIGSPYTRTVVRKYISKEQRTLLPLAAIVLLLMIFITVRSAKGVFLPIITASVSLLWTIGFMGYMDIPINLVTFMIPTLIIVIGSTEDVHILSEYMEGLRKHSTRDKAVHYMTSKISTAIMLTGFTTFLGFFSLSINKIIILKQFGIAAGFGLLVNPLVTAMVAPVFLRFCGSKTAVAENKNPLLQGLFKNIASWVLYQIHNRKKVTLGAIFAVTAVIGSFSFFIEINNDTLGYFKQDSEIIRRINVLHKNLAGSQVFFIRISSGKEGTFKNPNYLSQIAKIQDCMDKKGWFDKSVSIADYMKLIHKEMNNGEGSYYAIPHSRELISQYNLFLHREEIESYITAGYDEANIIVRHNITSSKELREKITVLEKEIKQILDPFFKFKITSESILINNATDSIAAGQVHGLVILLGIIFALMSLLFVNFKAGFLSLVPNILPVALNFGIMGLFGIPLDTGTCMVALIAIGIAVDDTVHLMTRYNKELKTTQDQKKAIDACIHSELVPVLSTSLALVLGFLILSFSNLVPIFNFGILAALVMVYAFLSDILVTPILLTSTQLITIFDMISLRLREEIQSSQLFLGMSFRKIKRVVLLGRVHEVEAGEFIINEGDYGDEMYVILHGNAKVFTQRVCDEDGKKDIELTTLSNGDVFGELALLNPGPRAANVQAETSVTYFAIDWKGLQRINRVYTAISSKLYFNLAKVLGMQVITLGNRIADMEHKQDPV